MKKLSTTVAAAAAVAAFAVPSQAFAASDPVDVGQWLKDNKVAVEFWLDVDVDTCKGVDGLSYNQALVLADDYNINLKELAKRTSPEEIMEYVNDSGITLGDIDRFLAKFCAGEVEIPPATATPDDDADGPGTTPSEGDSTAPGSGGHDSEGGDDSASPSATAPGSSSGDDAGAESSASAASSEDPEGSMAHTGASSPWLPLGIGAGALGVGSAAVVLARRRGVI